MITMIHFDTLHYVETLQAAGVSEKQAKAFARAQQETLSECLDTTLATKADLREVRAEAKADLHEVRVEARADLMEVKAELKADIGALSVRVGKVETEIRSMRWVMNLLVAGVGTLVFKAFFEF